MPKIYWFDGRDSYAPVSGKKGIGSFRGGTYNGQSTVEAAAAHEPGVQPAMYPYAKRIELRARANLTSGRLNDPGFDRADRASIHLEKGELDWGIHLQVNTDIPVTGVKGATGGSGLVAAMSIEYGHTGIGMGPIPFQVRGRRYPGKFILHRAAGLAPKRGVG